MRLPAFSKINLYIRNRLSDRKQGLQFLFYNLFGNGLTLLLNFALPFFFTVAGYGMFALLYAIFNLFSAIFTFGLDSTILKFSLDKKESSNVVMRCVGAWGILSLLAFSIITPITWYFSSSGILKASFSDSMITIFSAFIISFQRIILYYYIAKTELKKYGIVFVFNKLAQFLTFIPIALLFVESKSLSLMPYLFLFQSVITLMLILILEKNRLRFYIPTKIELQSLLKFTLPLSLETFGNIGYSYGFNLLISPFLSLGQLGTLNIFTQLGTIISMTTGAFNNGYLPRFFLHLEDDFVNTVKRYFLYILTNASFISIGVFILGAGYFFISDATNEEFPLFLLFIYLIGIFSYTFKTIGSSFLIIQRKTVKIASITLLTSLLNIGIGIFVTTLYGFSGCIFSLSFGYFLQLMFFNFDVLKKYREFTN